MEELAQWAVSLLAILAGGGITIRTVWRFREEKNGRGVVTKADLLKYQSECAGSLHRKIDGYHNTVQKGMQDHEGRIGWLEGNAGKD